MTALHLDTTFPVWSQHWRKYIRETTGPPDTQSCTFQQPYGRFGASHRSVHAGKTLMRRAIPFAPPKHQACCMHRSLLRAHRIPLDASGCSRRIVIKLFGISQEPWTREVSAVTGQTSSEATPPGPGGHAMAKPDGTGEQEERMGERNGGRRCAPRPCDPRDKRRRGAARARQHNPHATHRTGHTTPRTAQVTPHQRPAFPSPPAAAPLPSPAFSSPPRCRRRRRSLPRRWYARRLPLYSSPPSVPHFVFFQIRALNC